MKTLYAITITYRDGSTDNVTQEEFDSCKALAVVALRMSNISSTLKSPVLSIALANF